MKKVLFLLMFPVLCFGQYTSIPDSIFEQRLIDRYNNNQLPFLFHLCGGNEDQLIEIFDEVQDGDCVLATHRNHYQAYLHGIEPEVVEDRVMNGRSMFI